MVLLRKRKVALMKTVRGAVAFFVPLARWQWLRMKVGMRVDAGGQTCLHTGFNGRRQNGDRILLNHDHIRPHE